MLLLILIIALYAFGSGAIFHKCREDDNDGPTPWGYTIAFTIFWPILFLASL